jgi:hypothetical protein
MKMKFFVLIFLGLYNYCKSQTQPPALLWSQVYPKSSFDNSPERIVDFCESPYQNGYFLLGRLNSNDCLDTICDCDYYTDNNPNNSKQILYKLNSNGEIDYKICMGGIQCGYFKIVSSNDSNLILAGYAYRGNAEFEGYDIDTFTNDIVVLKIDTSGNVIWRTYLPGLGADDLNYLYCADNNHVFLLVNRFADPDGIYYEHYGAPQSFDEDSYVVELDENGNIIWSKAIGGNGYENLKSIIRLPNNDLVIGGIIDEDSYGYYAISNSIGGLDAYVVYLDSARNLKWNKRFGSNGIDYLSGILPLHNNEIMLKCSVADSATADVYLSHGNIEIGIYIIDTLGNIIKSKAFGGNKYDRSGLLNYKFFKYEDKIGIHAETNSTNGDIIPMYPNSNTITNWLFTIDTSLNLLNSYNLGSNIQYNEDIAITYYFDNNSFIVAEILSANCDSYSIEVEPNGAYWLYNIDQYTFISHILKDDLKVKIIPNPVRDKAIIELEGADVLKAKFLTVYDGSGRIINTIKLNRNKESLNVSDVPSGFYVYEVTDSKKQKLFSGKIMVQK